jgi:hypothetical protein
MLGMVSADTAIPCATTVTYGTVLTDPYPQAGTLSSSNQRQLGFCDCRAGVWWLRWQCERSRGFGAVAADWCWCVHGGGTYGILLQGE